MQFLIKMTLTVTLLLAGGYMPVSAQGTQGPGSFGGELRGITRVKGRVICVECSLQEAKAANPNLQSHLYEFDNGDQRAIFHVTGIGEVAGVQDPNDLAYWQAVTGLRKQLSVRIDEKAWKELTAEKNLQKEVELTTLLRNTGVLDVGQIAFADAKAE